MQVAYNAADIAAIRIIVVATGSNITGNGNVFNISVRNSTKKSHYLCHHGYGHIFYGVFLSVKGSGIFIGHASDRSPLFAVQIYIRGQNSVCGSRRTIVHLCGEPCKLLRGADLVNAVHLCRLGNGGAVPWCCGGLFAVVNHRVTVVSGDPLYGFACNRFCCIKQCQEFRRFEFFGGFCGDTTGIIGNSNAFCISHTCCSNTFEIITVSRIVLCLNSRRIGNKPSAYKSASAPASHKLGFDFAHIVAEIYRCSCSITICRHVNNTCCKSQSETCKLERYRAKVCASFNF